LRPIDNETGKHFLASTSVEDKIGTLLRSNPFGSAGFGDGGTLQQCFRPAVIQLDHCNEQARMFA